MMKKKRDVLFILGCLVVFVAAASAWLQRDRLEQPETHDWGMVHHPPNLEIVAAVDAAVGKQWQANLQEEPLPKK